MEFSEFRSLNEMATHAQEAQHALGGPTDPDRKEHADYMKKTHNVKTKFHGKDDLSYHGSKKNVKKALINHYDDHETAKELHPDAFK
jgi:hypothetical protein